MSDDKFVLTKEEIDHPLMRKLFKHFENRVQILRAQNDKDMSEKETSFHRGKISEAKYIVGLGKTKILID